MRKYINDFIINLLVIGFCAFALVLNVPEYGGLCDQDAMGVFVCFVLFCPIMVVFLVRNIKKLNHNEDVKFRKGSLVVFLILIGLSLGGLNKLIFTFYYGTLVVKAESIDNPFVYLSLYENGRFYNEGFYSSCTEQRSGTYKIEGGGLILFCDKQSEFISEYYTIENGFLINNDTLFFDPAKLNNF